MDRVAADVPSLRERERERDGQNWIAYRNQESVHQVIVQKVLEEETG